MDHTLDLHNLIFEEESDDYVLIQIIIYVAQVVSLFTNFMNLRDPSPYSGLRHVITYLGHQYLTDKMENNPEEFRRIYRMYPDCFKKLCIVLRERGHIHDTRYICVEEMIDIFLLTVSQNQRYSVSCERFDRSRFAVSICFNKALQALVDLSPTMMESPPNEMPNEVKMNPRLWSYFKDCIGAIDGTHIPCMIYGEDQTPYRNRHGDLSQNVLAACTFDHGFIYVLAGWEGSANDARVLKDAMSRAHKLPLPNNKFYLVECGYPNRLQFPAPYRGTRYHLQEFGNSRVRPRNQRELFNHRHSCLRNCIERIFGVFKSRFTIFKTQPPGFSYETQKKMVFACVGLHNFLRLENSNDDFDTSNLPDEAPRNLAHVDDDSDEENDLQSQHTQRLEACNWRDSIGEDMWNDGIRISQGI